MCFIALKDALMQDFGNFYMKTKELKALTLDFQRPSESVARTRLQV